MSNARFQKLHNVCNGGHLHDLGRIICEEDLLRSMRGESKVILIVSPRQQIVLGILRSLSKRRLSGGLRSKKLCTWSATADLWIVRR